MVRSGKLPSLARWTRCAACTLSVLRVEQTPQEQLMPEADSTAGLAGAAWMLRTRSCFNETSSRKEKIRSVGGNGQGRRYHHATLQAIVGQQATRILHKIFASIAKYLYYIIRCLSSKSLTVLCCASLLGHAADKGRDKNCDREMRLR